MNKYHHTLVCKGTEKGIFICVQAVPEFQSRAKVRSLCFYHISLSHMQTHMDTRMHRHQSLDSQIESDLMFKKENNETFPYCSMINTFKCITTTLKKNIVRGAGTAIESAGTGSCASPYPKKKSLV